MEYINGKKSIIIIDVAPYKHKSLLIGDGYHCWRVGSFISEESAIQFEKYLQEITGLEVKEARIDTLL